MANVQNKGNLFPESIVTNMMHNLVKGKSSLAALTTQKPVSFNGNKEFTFTFDKEIDVVAESGKKTTGGITVNPVTIIPVKIEYGARISDEFKYASEEVKLNYLREFSDGFAKKMARGIDIMALHGLNPRTKQASTVIGTNHFDNKVTQTVTMGTGNVDENVEAAVALVQGSEADVTGMIISPEFRAELAKLKNAQGGKLFPELAWGAQPGVLNGLKTEVNSTVSFGTSMKDRAVVGDFESSFRWGYAKEIPLEIIEYGNPDNDTTLGDLKGSNQIYLRAEAYIGWAVLNPKAFAIIKAQ